MKDIQNKLQLTVLFLFFLALTVSAQSKTDRDTLGEKYARAALKNALTDSTQHNVISKTRILLDTKEKAIKFAEPILFDIYGKKEIESEKPYDIYFIDNYWIISGTLPENAVGGTFLVIIDSHDCKILRITHGK
jgi:hypothetical protein